MSLSRSSHQPLAVAQRADDELSTREAALALGQNARSIRRAIERGELAAVKRGAGYRIAVDDLLRYAGRREPRAVPDQPARLVPFPSALRISVLPQPLSSFVGRSAEMAAAGALLESPAVRLLTLTGPGGVGKTRLALAVAEASCGHFPDGVILVDLAAVARPDLVLPAISQALGLREIAGRGRRAQLQVFLRAKRLLLVIDNLEHLLAAAPEIAGILAASPGVTVLATSRAPLRVAGEREFPVGPLPLAAPEQPVTAASLLASDAARLFIERAQAHDPHFRVDAASAPLIADICARLDGLPLAIELAAARTKVLSPRQLRDRLEQRLRLLNAGDRDAPQRHHTMHDTITWSYDLLSPDEQSLFRRLAVFAGGFTLSAAEYVEGSATPVSLDRISSLVDQSLLRREEVGEEPRFSMLETIREFGLEQLAAGEEEAARAAHAQYFLGLAQALRRSTMTRSTSVPIARLAEDEANLRAAHEWLAEHGPAADFAAMVTACYIFWYMVGRPRDAVAWITRALTPQQAISATDGAWLLIGYAELLATLGESAQAETAITEGVGRVRALGDPADLALALIALSASSNFAGKHTEAEAQLEEALVVAETIAEPTLRAVMTGRVLANLGSSARGRGDLELAAARGEEARRRYEGLGVDLAETRVLMDLAAIASDQGHHRLAAERYLECIEKTGSRGEARVIPDALTGIASSATAWGESREALLLFGAAQAMHEQVGTAMIFPPDIARVNRDLATLRALLGADETDATLAEGRALSVPEAVDLATRVAAMPGTVPAGPAKGALTLTRRERDVLRLLADGLTDREVGETLFIATRTVSWHVSAILGKLQATSRREAVARARTAGLL